MKKNKKQINIKKKQKNIKQNQTSFYIQINKIKEVIQKILNHKDYYPQVKFQKQNKNLGFHHN